MLALTSSHSISDCYVPKATRLSCSEWWLSWFSLNSVIPTLGKFVTLAEGRKKKEQFRSRVQQNCPVSKTIHKRTRIMTIHSSSFPVCLLGRSTRKYEGKQMNGHMLYSLHQCQYTLGKVTRACSVRTLKHVTILSWHFFFPIDLDIRGTIYTNFFLKLSPNFDPVSYE